MLDLQRHWSALWEQLGKPAPAGLLEELIDRYSEPQRSYHTVQHLAECLASFDELRACAERPEEAELALWFHDAVYDVRAHDNEAKSAELARAASARADLPSPVIERIQGLIMATRHGQLPATRDAEVVVDADLAILAAPAARFAEYERQIRDEYAYVPQDVFTVKRREVLQRFLDRERIYSTEAFRRRHEQQARDNLRRAIGLP